MDFTLCVEDNLTNDEYACLDASSSTMANIEKASNNLSLAGYHAQQDTHNNLCAISALLPLFRDSANMAAMMQL